MVRLQALEPRLHVVGQRVVGGSHVRVLRVGGDRRHDPRVQHRVAPGRILERCVGVPQPVAQTVGAAAIFALQYLPCFADVRYVGQRFIAEAVLLHRADAGLGMQLAVEALREGELLGVRERLPAKNQDGVLVHAGAYPLERRGIVNVAQLDPRHLGGESRVQLREGDGHVCVLADFSSPHGQLRFARTAENASSGANPSIRSPTISSR